MTRATRSLRIDNTFRTPSPLGHVWTAPWQELSDVAAALVGCGHVRLGLLHELVRGLTAKYPAAASLKESEIADPSFIDELEQNGFIDPICSR